MPFFKIHTKIIGPIFFVIIFIFFSTLQAKNYDKINNADNIADYFSGILLLNQDKYHQSYYYLKKLDGLEKSHLVYSSKYLYSLINSGNLNQAYNYAKKLEREDKDNFESNLIIGIKHLKNSRLDLANKYFLKAKNKNSLFALNDYLAKYLYNWSTLNKQKFDEATINLEKVSDKFQNFNKIQKVFLNCYYDHPDTDRVFNELVSDENVDFSRYNYFYANYLISAGKSRNAIYVLNESLKKYPRNLLINQFKIDFKNQKKKIDFDCKKEGDVIAEILYISANALASQSIFPLSNFYLNLAIYLNDDFKAFEILLAENLYNTKNYSRAKKTFEKIGKYGTAFRWHSSKQISRILLLEDKKSRSLNNLKEAYNNLLFKRVYETFDYAEFLKNNEKFEESIKYYTEVLNIIDDKHSLFTSATDGRGVAYERMGEWDKAESDLLASLKVDPDQAYVINYLAYSWIEKGIKIEKSLNMLKKANRIKSNDPYIIDSLGWALFKLKKYEDAKQYLQQAVRLMPADPVVNDHYGDVLWKNGKEIQARYYWNYVLGLEKVESELKEKIEKKIIRGL